MGIFARIHLAAGEAVAAVAIVLLDEKHTARVIKEDRADSEADFVRGGSHVPIFAQDRGASRE